MMHFDYFICKHISETSTTEHSSHFFFVFSASFNGSVDHFKMALDCFFAVWFVVGNVWIFGGHSSPSDAPKLYRYLLMTCTFFHLHGKLVS